MTAGLARLLSAAEAERELQVAGLAQRIRVWAHRERIHASGLDAFDRPLYRVAAISALLGDTPTPPKAARETSAV